MAPLHLLLHCATTLLIANALLTPQLPGTDSDGKSKGGFPFALDEEVDGVELPLEVDQDMSGDQAPARTQHSMPPAWLTFDPEPAPAPAPAPTKHRSSHKPQTIIKHPTSSGFHKLSAHGHRSCHVEVVKEVQGICQSMPIGSACVTDDYMAVYTDANCSAQ